MAIRRTTRSPTSRELGGGVTVMGSGATAGFAFWRDAMAWQRRVDRALRPLGLTHTQVLVLSSLDSAFRRAGEAVSQAAIAAEAGLDKVTVSAVLKALDSHGFINRDVGVDRRAWRIVITPSGRRVLASAIPALEEASSALPRRAR